MIVDSFPFFEEFDLLEVRFTILDPVVDRFVIVEGTRTFSGRPKALRFPEAKERYAKWWNKIDYIAVDDWPETDDPWIIENYQRNALARSWAKLADSDVIISSDLDEIPHPDVVRKYASMKGVKWFAQLDCRNFFNAQRVKAPIWMGGSRMLTYGEFKKLGELRKFKYNKFGPREINEGATAVKLRRMRDVILLPNGGWHFSFLGGVDAIIRKIQAYSHQERNAPEFLDRERLTRALAEGRTVSGNALRFAPLEELGLPKSALDVIRKFPDLIAPRQSDEVLDRLGAQMSRNMFRQKISRRYLVRLMRLWCAQLGLHCPMKG